ncbi:CD82 antigen-like isoform X2 [Seriola dumerili]|uniref:CD82 antigen-like isoform X2 n=1 Tax=Seriola dumerili TaxID=41447 RepID=UPI000BBE07D8|nr:CD82 antigen-like isoform X2 [Seriola dumerili]
MKLEVKIQLLKFCSAVFNSLFLALGLSVAGCAVWILFGKGNFLTVLSSVELSTVAVGLLIIGGVVVSVSVVGCIGADGEHRFLLLTYLGFLIILVLGQLFVTLLLLINRNKIERSLDAAVDQIILQYGGSSSQDALMDNVQHYGECCGRTGPADWLKNSYIQSLNLTRPDVLPCSCFSSYRRSFNSSWCSELLNYTEPPYGRGNSSYDQDAACVCVVVVAGLQADAECVAAGKCFDHPRYGRQPHSDPGASVCGHGLPVPRGRKESLFETIQSAH